MNIQAMMKQAQKMQKDMMAEKKIIDDTLYTGKSSIVEVTIKGNKLVDNIKINAENLDKEDIDMLEDMIMVAVNEAMKKIDSDQESKMGKYTQGMPGLF